MGFRAEVVLVTLLGLAHFRVALTVLVFGRTLRVDQGGIDDGALAQRQFAIPQLAVDHVQSSSRQLMLFQQAVES